MSEKVTVEPAPVQRNVLDVAVELTVLHVKCIGVSSKDDIEKLYIKYFATVKLLNELGIKAMMEFANDEVKMEAQKYFQR